MITGKKYHQDTIANFKEGLWTVTIKVQYHIAKDEGDWEDKSEFDATAFSPSYEEAFQSAVEEIAAYLIEWNEEEDDSEKPAITENNTTS